MTDHLTHRKRFSYDEQGTTSQTCLDCDVPLETIWRICPTCGTPFDGTTIGATLEARILCADCSRVATTQRRRRPGRP